MDFRRASRFSSQVDEPEINFIPLIDVLLVVLIFLMVTTTYSRYSELQIALPNAEAKKAQQKPREIAVAITASGSVTIESTRLSERSASSIASSLRDIANGQYDATVVIHADAGTPHQAVIDVMEGARGAGLAKVAFTTQSGQARSP